MKRHIYVTIEETRKRVVRLVTSGPVTLEQIQAQPIDAVLGSADFVVREWSVGAHVTRVADA